jgi:hypothetical protein
VTSLPFASPAEVGEVAETMLQPFLADAVPHFYVLSPVYDFADEFMFGFNPTVNGFEWIRDMANYRGSRRNDDESTAALGALPEDEAVSARY